MVSGYHAFSLYILLVYELNFKRAELPVPFLNKS